MRQVKTSKWLTSSAAITAVALAFAGCSGGGGGGSNGSYGVAPMQSNSGAFSGGIAGLAINPPGDLVLDSPSGTNVGQTFQIAVDVYDAQDNALDYTRQVTYDFDSSILTVNSQGQIVAVAPGQTDVTVSVQGMNGTLTATKSVTVVPAPAAPATPSYTNLAIYPLSRTLANVNQAAGQTQQQQIVVVATDDSGRMWDLTRSDGAQVLNFNDPNANPLPPSVAGTLDPNGLFQGEVDGENVLLYLRLDQFGLLAGSHLILGNGLARPVGPGDLFDGGPLIGSQSTIDRALLAELQVAGAQVSQRSSDGEFLRRIYSDAVGRRPSEAEVVAFDGNRNALIDNLVASREFADYWGTRIAEQLLMTDVTFDTWVADQIAAGRNMRQIYSDLIAGTGAGGTMFNAQHFDPVDPAAGDPFRPHQVVDVIGEAALASRLKCGTCHGSPDTGTGDLPIESLTYSGLQDDRYMIQAFFATDPEEARKLDKFDARFGNPLEPGWPLEPNVAVTSTLATPLADRRAEAATLFTNSALFDRAQAMRFFADVVQPLLDTSYTDKRDLDMVLVPQTMDAIVQAFTDAGAALPAFAATVFKSETYQLSSAGASTQYDALLARHTLRRDYSEQAESLVMNVTGMNVGLLGFFRQTFGYPLDRLTIDERSVGVNMSQQLVINNSPAVQDNLTNPTGRVAVLATDVDGQAITLDQAITSLWLSAYARQPSAAELTAARNTAQGAPTTADGLADVATALMASLEAMAH